jgi:hypothetical protein
MWRLKRNPPWLLVFVGGSGDEEKHVKKFLKTASLLTDRPIPEYCPIRIDAAKTLAFPTGVPVDNELAELFSEAVLDDLIREKRKIGTTHAALIIARNAFPDAEVFRATVKDSINDDSIYHLICTWTDFLGGATPRKNCYDYSCAQCGKLEDGCAHSCLPRLLWLMFSENRRVLDVFK